MRRNSNAGGAQFGTPRSVSAFEAHFVSTSDGMKRLALHAPWWTEIPTIKTRSEPHGEDQPWSM